MRTRCALLLALPAAALVSAAVGMSAPTSLPGADYPWAHPGTASVTVEYGQPPAWIPIAAPARIEAAPGSSYIWAHPGMPAVNVPYAQPPAEIPTG